MWFPKSLLMTDVIQFLQHSPQHTNPGELKHVVAIDNYFAFPLRHLIHDCFILYISYQCKLLFVNYVVGLSVNTQFPTMSILSG